MINDVLHFMILPGNGIIFSRIVFDMVCFLPFGVLTFYIFSTLLASVKLINVLDRMAGFHVSSSKYNQPHWFEGHKRQAVNYLRLQYQLDHEGLTKMCARPIDFPGLFNFHVTPWLSCLHTTHPQTVAPLISSSAPKFDMAYGFLKPWIGNGLLRSNGDYWQRHRRLITPAFHFSILKSYIPTFNDCAKEMLDKLDSTKGEPIEVFEPVGLLTLDTMLRCAMSTTTNCQSTKERHPYVRAIHTLSDAVVMRMNTPWLFPDWIFNLSPVGRRYRKALDIVHSFTETIITGRRRELLQSSSDVGEEEELNYRGVKLRNFIDTLLTSKDEDGVMLTDEEIREEVDTFLFEGHDTTSSGISWALHNLATHPDYQSRCRKEINDVLESKENLGWSDLTKLDYLTMCLKESLRLHPPVPMVLRALKKPLSISSQYNVSGMDAPTGSVLGLNIMCLHRNPYVWDKPHKYDPERFSKENVHKVNVNSFLPFAAGSRNCIGQNFAMNEMKVVLAQTLRRFKLSIDPSTPEPRMTYGLVLRSENGIHIKFDEL